MRKRWLLRRVCELAVFSGLLLFIANQYLEPAVSNAMKPLSQSDWWRVVERVLKLALPNLYAWLVSWGAHFARMCTGFKCRVTTEGTDLGLGARWFLLLALECVWLGPFRTHAEALGFELTPD